MSAVAAVVAPPAGGEAVGLVVLVLIFLLLVAGLVVVVRLLAARLHPARIEDEQGETAYRASSKEGATGSAELREATRALDESRANGPLTGAELKRRYLSGKISRAEYDERLRRLQIEEFLEDDE